MSTAAATGLVNRLDFGMRKPAAMTNSRIPVREMTAVLAGTQGVSMRAMGSLWMNYPMPVKVNMSVGPIAATHLASHRRCVTVEMASAAREGPIINTSMTMGVVMRSPFRSHPIAGAAPTLPATGSPSYSISLRSMPG